MRLVLCALVCLLMTGCGASPPPKPSPYRNMTPERVKVRSVSCTAFIHP